MGIPDTWSGFATIECCLCHTGFAVEQGLYTARKNDRRSFWCPNGHEQHFTGRTAEQEEIARLKRERDAAQAEALRQKNAREWAESRAKGANIAAGKAKAAQRRLVHRVECGVCPHCQRTFKQLAAHMKAKHGSKRMGVGGACLSVPAGRIG